VQPPPVRYSARSRTQAPKPAMPMPYKRACVVQVAGQARQRRPENRLETARKLEPAKDAKNELGKWYRYSPAGGHNLRERSLWASSSSIFSDVEPVG
jgi:hypothetical protein